MNIKKHCQLLAYSFLTWLSFYLLGLPEYYQQWYLWAKVDDRDAGHGPTRFPSPGTLCRRIGDDGKHITNACWLALYLTVATVRLRLRIAWLVQRPRNRIRRPVLVPDVLLLFILATVSSGRLVDEEQ